VGAAPDGYDRRHSFCCAEESCRRRTTPASVRFLGPKVYLGAIVALVTALRHGANAGRIVVKRDITSSLRVRLERLRDLFANAATSITKPSRLATKRPLSTKRPTPDSRAKVMGLAVGLGRWCRA